MLWSLTKWNQQLSIIKKVPAPWASALDKKQYNENHKNKN